MRAAVAFLVFVTIALPAHARSIAIRFEPAQQKVATVRVRSAGDAIAAAVAARIVDAQLLLPEAVSPPLIIEADGFEPALHTNGKAVVLRALGTLAGTVVRRSTRKETLTWLLRRSDASAPTEIEFTVDADQRYRIALPAGVYQGAIVGEGLASYSVAAIVIRPGERTESKPITLAATAPASFRVVDQANGKPVRGARVTWNPPAQELNAETSRVLFSRRWSGITDAEGRVSFASVGPVPIPVRWRVEAPSYPPADTAPAHLRGDGRAAIADVALRRPASVTVRVTGPRRGELPKGTLVLLAASEDGAEYKRESSAALKEGEVVFRGVPHGRKRVQVIDESGTTLSYEDFVVERESATIDLVLEPVEISGVVTRGGSTVSGARVVFSDPLDPSVTLLKATTNFLGRYEGVTWKRGRVSGYAIEYAGQGRVSGNARAEIVIAAGEREATADFEFDAAGLTLHVVNGVTGEPVAGALVDRRIHFHGGGFAMGTSETDGEGKLELLNYRRGTAKLYIRAKGFRASEVELPVDDARREQRVALQPARRISGQVVGPDDLPVPGALIEGGYSGEASTQAAFVIRADAQGEFAIDWAPMVGTTFYVMAPGYALTTTTLRAADDNRIRLERPSTGFVQLLTKDGAPPAKIYRVVPASGGAIVPMGVLNDLARMNGLTQFQLLSSGRDGAVILPRFLPAGSWELYITRRGGAPFLYDRIGTVAMPLRGMQALTLTGE